MLIVNGTVHPIDAPDIPNGFVDVREGKIWRVGFMEQCPSDWEGEVLDANQGHILPGFIDAHCHLGMFGDSLGFEGDDGNESTDPCTPHLRAIDAINPLDRCFQEARAAGVTTVMTGPGSANPISGQFAALKTNGTWVDTMLRKAPAAMKLALGENPKCVYNERHETPVTRMATAAILRENLAKAAEYRDKLRDEEEDSPDYDAKLEALLPVLDGTLPVHIHAHRADDIATGVRICKEFQLNYVIVHGTEGHLIADLLAQEKAAVITGPCLGDRSKPELANMTLENPAKLLRAGVPAYEKQIQKAVRRGDWVSVNHRTAAFLESYFDVLFALNRQTHPGEKRLVELCREKCERLPERFEENLTALFSDLFVRPERTAADLNEILVQMEKIIAGMI